MATIIETPVLKKQIVTFLGKLKCPSPAIFIFPDTLCITISIFAYNYKRMGFCDVDVNGITFLSL